MSNLLAHTVTFIPNNHGYPYQARCECGWRSKTHRSAQVAHAILRAHLIKGCDPVVTEPDILDTEREAMSRWIVCSECGTVLQAIDGYRDDTCIRCVHWLQHG